MKSVVQYCCGGLHFPKTNPFKKKKDPQEWFSCEGVLWGLQLKKKLWQFYSEFNPRFKSWLTESCAFAWLGFLLPQRV